MILYSINIVRFSQVTNNDAVVEQIALNLLL